MDSPLPNLTSGNHGNDQAIRPTLSSDLHLERHICSHCSHDHCRFQTPNQNAKPAKKFINTLLHSFHKRAPQPRTHQTINTAGPNRQTERINPTHPFLFTPDPHYYYIPILPAAQMILLRLILYLQQ